MRRKILYPNSPEQWDNPRYTLFREFDFRSTPDLEILIRLVKENMSDKGNSGYTRARLLGILRSKYHRANQRFWIKHYHPKTWWIRYQYSRLKRYLAWRTGNRFYRSELMLSTLAKQVIKEEQSKDKSCTHTTTK